MSLDGPGQVVAGGASDEKDAEIRDLKWNHSTPDVFRLEGVEVKCAREPIPCEYI